MAEYIEREGFLWVPFSGIADTYCCENCKEALYFPKGTTIFEYCPWCGKEMIGVQTTKDGDGNG